MEPETRIHQAFLQLQFAIKLCRHFEMGLVQKEIFDEAGTFHTYDDLVLSAQNVYSSTLGVCAIAMESALTQSGVANDPSDVTARGQLRSFIYQVRNAFAHDAMTPVWSARGPYSRTYDLQPFGILEPVNLEALKGRALELEQFGGMCGFEALRDAVLEIVTRDDSTPRPNKPSRPPSGS